MDLENRTHKLGKKHGVVAFGVGITLLGAIGLSTLPDYQTGTLHVDRANGIIFHDTDNNGTVSGYDTMYVADETPLTQNEAYERGEELHDIQTTHNTEIDGGALYATYKGTLRKVGDSGRLQFESFEPEDANRIIGNVIRDGHEIDLYQ
jgi:hypothetical protein